MGTYISYKLPEGKRDRQTVRAFNKQYHGQLYAWDPEDAVPPSDADLYELGTCLVGVKLSCTEPADLEQALDALASAREQFGLEIGLPENTLDYLTEQQVARIADLKATRLAWVAERRDADRWTAAADRAMDLARSKYGGLGVWHAPYWGPKGSHIALAYGKGGPCFLQVHYRQSGSMVPDDDTAAPTRSQLYRDANGVAVMMVPTRPIFDEVAKNQKWVEDVYTQAADLGLRAPYAAFACALYGAQPHAFSWQGKRWTRVDSVAPVGASNGPGSSELVVRYTGFNTVSVGPMLRYECAARGLTLMEYITGVAPGRERAWFSPQAIGALMCAPGTTFTADGVKAL